MSHGQPSLKFTVVLLIWVSTSVSSTFSLSGSVFIDCGGQQTFTCTVAAANGPASWTITGLQGITATGSNGVVVANNNARITSAESIPGLTSTITITGFTTADNGGTVQCIDQVGAVEGSATVVVGPPQCGQVGVDYSCDSCPSFTFTPQGSVQPLTVVVSYQLVGDPSSAGSLNCDYPVDSRMCRLVVPGGIYNVRLTPQNSCGSPISTCSSRTELIPANCTLANRLPATTAPTPTVSILSGVIPSVVLILTNIISVVVAVLVTRHCYKKSAKGGSSSRQEELYAQVEGKKVYEDINMTDSPAYGPTSSQNK